MSTARYIRRPEIGWKQIHVRDNGGQILYLPASPNSNNFAFSKVVLNARISADEFQFNFQKPKDVTGFETLLTKIMCVPDPLERTQDCFYIKIDRLRIPEILAEMKQAGFLSDLMVNDISASIKEIEQELQTKREELNKNQAEKKMQEDKWNAENSLWVEKQKQQNEKLNSIIRTVLDDPKEIEIMTDLTDEEKMRMPVLAWTSLISVVPLEVIGNEISLKNNE